MTQRKAANDIDTILLGLEPKDRTTVLGYIVEGFDERGWAQPRKTPYNKLEEE